MSAAMLSALTWESAIYIPSQYYKAETIIQVHRSHRRIINVMAVGSAQTNFELIIIFIHHDTMYTNQKWNE